MTYTIIPTGDLTEAIINVCQEDELEGPRKSVDQLSRVLKWQGDTPALLEGVTTYTHAEIKLIMFSPEWTEVPDE